MSFADAFVPTLPKMLTGPSRALYAHAVSDVITKWFDKDGNEIPGPKPVVTVSWPQGWECPRCRVIHGPWVQSGGCMPPYKTWAGTGTGTDPEDHATCGGRP